MRARTYTHTHSPENSPASDNQFRLSEQPGIGLMEKPTACCGIRTKHPPAFVAAPYHLSARFSLKKVVSCRHLSKEDTITRQITTDDAKYIIIDACFRPNR